MRPCNLDDLEVVMSEIPRVINVAPTDGSNCRLHQEKPSFYLLVVVFRRKRLILQLGTES